MRVSSCCTALVLLTLTACQQGQQNDASTSTANPNDEPAIRQVLQRELAAARANNPDSFAVVMSADATVKPPNEPPVTGPALQSWIKNMFANVTLNQVTYTDDQITVSGDMAVHYYGFDWTLTPKGGPSMQEKGHGVHVLRRQTDGSWRISYDTWSADSAPSQAATGESR